MSDDPSLANDAGVFAEELAGAGVQGLTIAWADNNGIPRSRTVPIGRLADVAVEGVGITSLFAVFDSHDAITFGHPGLATPSGDVRLIPEVSRITRLAGQPAFAWAPGRQVASDGSPWPYDQRSALEAQVERAAAQGLELRAGYELEFFVGYDDDAVLPAHAGPAYSPHALLAVDEFAAQLLADLADNGLQIGQLHAEYGLSQVELSLAAADPVTAADDQLLARQTIRAAARAHGLRVSFAPLVAEAAAGNGWHVHASVLRDGVNLLAGQDAAGAASGRGRWDEPSPEGAASGRGRWDEPSPEGAASGRGRWDEPSPEGAAFIAGVLRDLPAVAAVSAPSVPSLARLRPGYFASAFGFWGVQNREAALRYVPGAPLPGPQGANVELKPSDASGNPYLALAALFAAGLAGIDERLPLPEPIQEDPGTWSDEERERRGVVRLPATPAEQEAALTGSDRVCAALGEERLGAFLAVRRADAAWAAERELDEVVAAHLWRY